MKKLLILILLLLSFSLALAVTTDKTTYNLNENVQISGTCALPNVPVAFQLGIGLNTIWVEQATATAQKSFTAAYQVASEGTHTLYAACNGEAAQTVTFCVGAGCPAAPAVPADDSSGNGGGGNGGGGGSRCKSSWSCTTWSFCNATLEQSRRCYDANNCQDNKVELRNCSECRESWVCGLWSECQNGQNYRTCVDDHKCGTTYLQPFLSKACEAVVSGPEPVSYNQQIQPPYVAPVTQQPAPVSLWDKYKTFIIAIPSGLIFVILIVLLAVHFAKPKQQSQQPQQMAYNLDDLREWIKKEQAMGTSNEDIKQILKQHTGWTDSEIGRSFSEL